MTIAYLYIGINRKKKRQRLESSNGMVYSVIGEGEYFECGVGGQNKEGKKKRYSQGGDQKVSRREKSRQERYHRNNGKSQGIKHKRKKKMIHQLQMVGTSEGVKLKNKHLNLGFSLTSLHKH